MTENESLRGLFGLEGRHVLVTGGSSVISAWIARISLLAGARVTLTDRTSADALRAAHAAHAAAAGDPGLAVADRCGLVGGVDVRNRTPEDAASSAGGSLLSVREMVQQSMALNGPVAVLVNVAGGQEPVPAAALDTAVFRRTLDRILLGTWNVIHEVFLQCMREHGGRVLSITADIEQGFPTMPGMGAARAGLESLHKAIAVEWAAAGVTSCVVAPGAVDTPGLRRYPGADVVREIAVEASLQERLIAPEEVAWLFVTLASPLARSVNGRTVVANCGDSLVTPVFAGLRRRGLTGS